MSSVEDRQNSNATTGQKTTTGTLQLSELAGQNTPVEQLSFPQASPHPFVTALLPENQQQSFPRTTRSLTGPDTSPRVTRSLSRFVHGSLLAEKQMIQDWVAESHAEMQAARLLTLNAAWKMDELHAAGRHYSDARLEMLATA